MAFFKFRQRSAAPAKKASRKSDASGAPSDTIEGVRRRARHRLIGAVVLVVLAVIGFPLLFDTEPRPVAVNAPITIPDREGAPPLAVPKPVGQSALPAAAGLDEREEVLPPAAAQGSPKPAAATAGAAQPQSTAAAPAERDASAQARRAEEAQARAKAQHDEQQARAQREAEAKARREAEAARALAALEGRSSAKPAAAAAADPGRYVVQIGAFAEADSAQQARRKAEGVGLKTYTQVVSTAEGKRTRVRVGPFASRAEAEQAAAALKKAGLPGSVLTL